MRGISSYSLVKIIRLTRSRVDEEEIDTQTETLRKKLMKESGRGGGGPDKRGLKVHQVHELAEAKIKQDDRFRSALGINRNYEEGSHWKKQEERQKKMQDTREERDAGPSRDRD